LCNGTSCMSSVDGKQSIAWNKKDASKLLVHLPGLRLTRTIE